MNPIIFHIYGPIAIHSFGTMIALGLIITLYLLHHDKHLRTIITTDQLATIIQMSFFCGIFGGRTLFLLTNYTMIDHWTSIFAVWAGGLSILGAIIGIIVGLTAYFSYTHLPQLRILDRLALYTPLLQSISRFGCFFAGCCYGKNTHLPWAISYTNPECFAPLYTWIHPTQIYSSLSLACCFILLLFFDRYYHNKKPGQILALYLMLTSIERFIIDYFRGDQEFFNNSFISDIISIQQLLALCLFIAGCLIMLFVTLHTNESKDDN